MTASLLGSSTFRSLRYRNARLFFGGLAVSNIGNWMQLTAMSLLVYRLTGRTTDIGLMVALQFLPILVLGAWTGAVADRGNKRILSIVTQALFAVQALVLGVLDLTDRINLPLVYVLTLAMGLVTAFDNPARRGFVTELVEPREISNIVSLNTAVMTGSRIFGPAVAALLVGPLGTGWLFTINGITSVAILVSLFSIDTSELRPPPRAPRGGTPVRDAMRFVRTDPTMYAAFVVFTVVSTFGFNYTVALPKLADENWGGEAWYGWLLAVVSVGSLLGSLTVASRPYVTMRWLALNGVILGLGGLAVAWAPNLPAAMLAGIPLGFGGAGFVTSMNAITQNECPPEMRGRILALTGVAFLGSTPIGGPVTGWVGDHVGSEWSLAYGALISLATVAAMIWWTLGRHRPTGRLAMARSLLGTSWTAVAPSSAEHA